MNNGLMTEEFKQKKSYKGLILVIVIIFLLTSISYGVYKYVSYRNEIKNKKELEESLKTNLNNELQNISRFAISNNYITAIKKDGSIFNIYNLLQGTGNFGDFTAYFYYDKKLYLLFSDNSLYTISLDSGDGVYELTKIYTFDNLMCSNNTTSKTSDIAFNNSTMYFNTSSCGVTRLSYDNKEKKYSLSLLKTFNITSSSIEYSNITKSLYVKADNSIMKFDNKTGEISTIVNNVNTDIPIIIKNNILIYSNNSNNSKSYYGYNIKTNENGLIKDNIEYLLVYKDSFIYRNNDTIYMLKNNKITEIYKVHYNNLSNMQLINDNVLQIVDKDINDEEKMRIINIDLSTNKYNTSNSKYEFNNIVEYIE